ncbi:hypothetical protein TSOC_006043 [Tetrabaena socialis]|uniref:Uncharacterized protein n=1 Tax=Tetrabaena socialis TaxID=47790 RepID=A0A2J8A4S4_9CHLO|nr:hypothetical protein TSOC_006043 [Tetrabaena socialis]|eukprot:PNH07505.1 hypothetical protein TSOC_006043 [Tetrabaena socialis]
MVFGCFRCSVPLVPDEHTELSRDELKRLYDRSVALNGGKLFVHGGSMTLSRGDIDNVILNKLVTKESFDPASTSFATRLDQPPHFGTAAAATPITVDGVGIGVGAAGGGGPGGGAGAGGTNATSAVAAAAAETRGPAGMDASYAAVHAAATQRGAGGGGELEPSWSMHPNALNASTCSSPDASGERHAGAGGGGKASTSGSPPKHAQHPSLPQQQGRYPADPGGSGGGGSRVRVRPVVVSGGSGSSGGLRGRGQGGPGGAGSGASGGRGGGGADEDQAALLSWLGQIPGGEAMAAGFLEIRSSLVAFAALYQLHQRRLEAALLAQLQAQQGQGQAHVARL